MKYKGITAAAAMLAAGCLASCAAAQTERILPETESDGTEDREETVPTVYRVEDDRLVFTIGNEERIEETMDLGRIYQEVCQEPADATLDPENGYQITEAKRGVDFDLEAARKALAQAKEGSTVTVGLVFSEPEISTADLEAHLFRDELAVYTTQVSGTEGRRENIRLAAQRCSGSILLSGEVFSYNDTVGEQTAETGFYLANATEDGKLVQAYGGGICQVSSTIFAAALYADLEIEERWEHEYVPRYIDAGIDAAVAWGALDLKLCNDKKYPVRIDVSYTDGILEVTILGTKTDDSVIEIETEVLDDSGGRLLVQTYRNVYNGDKSQMFLEKVAYSDYIH